jgi:spoIIIJ-associated protein
MSIQFSDNDNSQTDEQQIQKGQQWLLELLQLMAIPAQVHTSQVEDESSDESKVTWLTIDESNLTPEQINLIIGNEGATIDAIQYLANALLNIKVESGNQRYFTIELNGYRVKRQGELLALAEEVAQKVRETGEEVEVKALSSAERRQIHSFLSKSGDLTTESRGQEPDRRLVVRPR